MKKLFILFIVLLGTQITLSQSKKQLKQEKAKQEYLDMKELIASGKYKFVGDRAMPMGHRSISLTSNPNFVKINDGKADAYMPFFGERYSGGGYGDGGAIEFKADMEKYKVSYNDKKQRVDISFTAKGKSELFQVNLSTSGGGWANMIIKGVDRSSMSYNGKVSEFREEDNK